MNRIMLRIVGLGALLGGIALCLFLLSHGPALGPWERYGLRGAIAFLAITAWFWSQSLIGSRPLRGGEITDGIHQLTSPLHAHLVSHPKTADRVLIISSLFIDLFGLFLIGAGIFGVTMRPLVGLLILFTFRQVSQALCALPVPKGMIWRHPGAPSLLVTYGVGNDFFFSGHTAVATLGAIELIHVAPLWVGAVAGVIAFLEAATVLVLRAHYTMDIIAAIGAAWGAFSLASWLCQTI